MSVSFEKNREKILAAWKDVLDDKSSTDWALFGYEGQTNELKVVASGEGGLDEICEDLNSGKIMYAFVRIQDPKTSLKKFLLINWQGEGAPVLRKGTCANHIHDVAKFLAGAHLTINARVEDDIDKERILKKLSAVSSAYSFKEPRTIQDEPKAPVGTNYTRVIPAKELNPTEMQNFWKKEEQEEKHRIEMEQERKRQDLFKREEESRSREEKEHREREKKITDSNKLESAHVPIKTSPQPLSPIKTLSSPTRTMTEAERMRQQRSQEARELIGSRVGTAKAIFTQNTSDGQMQTKSSNAPAKPVRNSIAQKINAFNNAQQTQPQSQEIPDKKLFTNGNTKEQVINVREVSEEEQQQQPVAPEVRNEATEDPLTSQQNVDNFVEVEEQYSTIKRSPHSKSNSLASPDENPLTANPTSEVIVDQQGYSGVNTVANNAVLTEPTGINNNRNQNAVEQDVLYQDILSDGGLKARALYDYQAADESEITFDPGDVITHIDQIDEGWWQGLGPDGTYGLFPANYVELIN